MKTLVLLSGGLDSTTLLCHLVDVGHKVQAISFNYGQRHLKELQAARHWTEQLKIAHIIVDVPNVFAGSALTGDSPVPEGHYSDASMRSTVVPNRNMVFLAIAVSKALQLGFNAVAYAAHASDAAVYPDCRPGFVAAMGTAVARCDERDVALLAPFLRMTKGEIAGLGHRLGIDYSTTWSCYNGGEQPCGKCGPCVARAEIGV